MVHSFEEGRVGALAEEYMEVVPGIQKVGDNKRIGEEGMAGEDRVGDILHRQRDTGFLVTQSNQTTNQQKP